ncbi:hypothetical protein L0337_17580 [candidate division KSB1 bacterium]|nr:hypothetical protein [candidate division KSB1 bacterium]
MFDDPGVLGFSVVIIAGISGAILVTLFVKFFERRDRRQAGRNPTS